MVRAASFHFVAHTSVGPSFWGRVFLPVQTVQQVEADLNAGIMTGHLEGVNEAGRIHPGLCGVLSLDKRFGVSDGGTGCAHGSDRADDSLGRDGVGIHRQRVG